MSNDNIRNKLGRFENQITPKKKTAPPKLKSKALPERYHKLADHVGGELCSHPAGSYVLIKTLYPIDYIHGTVSFSSARIDKIPLPAFYVKNLKGSVAEADLLFIDTETTGLGGSGAVPFLVGCASMTAKGFEVRQYLMPDYHDEAGMLEDIMVEFSDSKSLISYNGASFDLPLLLDRVIINRTAREIPYEHHLDLLHGVRRIFKRRLKDCRLSNIEEKLFNLKRVDDLPGYLVPSVYFEWLNEDNLDLMEDILEHNRIDIVSLYFLVSLLSRVYQSEGETLDSIEDLHGLARFFNRQKQIETVDNIYDKMEILSRDPLSPDMILFHAANFKRTNRIEKAVELWISIAEGDDKISYRANIELAKYYEHHKKDVKSALNYAQKAVVHCPYGPSEQKQVAHRLDRLKKKLKTV